MISLNWLTSAEIIAVGYREIEARLSIAGLTIHRVRRRHETKCRIRAIKRVGSCYSRAVIAI